MTLEFLTDAQRAFHESVRRFADTRVAPLAASIDETDEFPAALFREMGELGYLGAACAPEYGGAGADAVMVALMMEEVARASGAVACSLNAHVSLASAVLHHHGSEAQKRTHLARLATGDAIGAFGLTEPSGGSDAAACRTRAVREGARYRITGSKCFITNSPVADVFVVTARTSEAPGWRGVSAFIVERDTPGFTVGPPDKKHGVHGSPTATLYFDGAEVPAENLIGREGEGFRQFAHTLDRGRVNVAALAIGIAQAALDAAVGYARQRHQFGRPIAAFQGVQWPIADGATEIAASRLLTLHAARLADAGRPLKKEAGMAKLLAAETALRVSNAAVEIFGGAGYMREQAVERFLRDAKMCQIGEGTSQIQRLVIAREVLGRFE